MFSRVARPLLAVVSVANGVEDLLNPKPKIEAVAPLLAKTPAAVNPALVVQAGAAVKITAGLLMGLGRMPRLAAIVLAADLIPTTVAEHPFSAATSPDARKARQASFLSNCGLLGGLLLASTIAGRKRRRR
ncbi:MAG: DoxX family membrane protein [Pseudonocardiaceae bacterium]